MALSLRRLSTGPLNSLIRLSTGPLNRLSQIFQTERVVYLSGEINEQTVYEFNNSLQILDDENNQPIKLIINSLGGQTTQALVMCDKMNQIKSDVHTHCNGHCASMASIILANGTKGKRTITPHSTVCIHEPFIILTEKTICNLFQLNGIQKFLEFQREQMINIYMKTTENNRTEIEELMRNDTWLTSEEAIEHQFVDSIEK